MKYRKIIKILVCAACISQIAAGCGKDNTDPVENTEITSESTEAEETYLPEGAAALVEMYGEDTQSSESDEPQVSAIAGVLTESIKKTVAKANVYNNPSEDAVIYGSQEANTSMTVYGDAVDGWYKVSYNGRVCYMQESAFGADSASITDGSTNGDTASQNNSTASQNNSTSSHNSSSSSYSSSGSRSSNSGSGSSQSTNQSSANTGASESQTGNNTGNEESSQAGESSASAGNSSEQNSESSVNSETTAEGAENTGSSSESEQTGSSDNINSGENTNSEENSSSDDNSSGSAGTAEDSSTDDSSAGENTDAQ